MVNLKIIHKDILMKNAIKTFLNSGSGNISILWSISAVAVIGAAGVAIDFSRASMTTTQLQSLLDSATVAGVSSSLDKKKQIGFAEKFYQANRGTEFSNYKVEFAIAGRNLKGMASGEFDTSLSRVLGIESVKIAATSLATSSPALEPICLMAMHPTRKHTLEMNGSVKIHAPNCNIYGNSNNTDDVIDPHTSQNEMIGLYIGTIGGGHHYLENVHPTADFGTELVLDPLSGLEISSVGSCIKSKYTITNTNMTLPAGHYCGGLTINNNSEVLLEDGGTYYISGGSFIIADSELKGKNVTVILTDAATNIGWSNSKIVMSAKTEGDFAGLAIIGQRVNTNNTFDSSTIDINGAVYMPLGAFDWINKGTPEISAGWSAFVVDGFSWSGNGVVNINFDLENSTIPFPKALIAMPRPAGPRLVQ